MPMQVTSDEYREVIVDNSAISRQRLFDDVLDYFKNHNLFTGESVFQSDLVQCSAASFLSDVADSLFTTTYKDD